MTQFVDWFNKVINDPDVLADTKIDKYAAAEIIAQTGARVDSFETFFHKESVEERTYIDIGILRLPDPAHPYIKVSSFCNMRHSDIKSLKYWLNIL